MGDLQKSFATAEDVAQILQCSVSKGYKICRELNNELQKQGFKTMCGRTSLSYLLKRYGLTEEFENANA